MQIRSVFTRLAAAAAAVAMFAGPVGAAVAAGPFVGFPGLWLGEGIVTYASGDKEPVRCRVQYIQSGEDDLQQALRCASDSYKFEINAFFRHIDGAISGRWDELIREVSGKVDGDFKEGKVYGVLTGPGFAVDFALTIDGNRQSVMMESPEEEIRAVAIDLRRTSR